jgi:hypothetical protein
MLKVFDFHSGEIDNSHLIVAWPIVFFELHEHNKIYSLLDSFAIPLSCGCNCAAWYIQSVWGFALFFIIYIYC